MLTRIKTLTDVNIPLNHFSNRTPPAAIGPLGGSTAVLQLTLYGPMKVRDALGTDATPRIRKSRAVLAVLAMASPKPVLRDQFAALLWSQRDRDQGRASLRQCVHELQSTLAADPLVLLA